MLGAQTVSIVSRSEASTDAYGLETYTTATRSVSKVLVAPGASSDTTDVNRNPADDSFTLYFPAGTAINAGDLFVIGSDTFERDGRADVWVNPAGLTEGVVVTVKRRLG